jgi:hypothetical protein
MHPMNLQDIIKQLRAERDRFDQAISALESPNGTSRKNAAGRLGRRISAAGRARIAAAARARWAKVKGESSGATKSPTSRGKRTMSASARRKIAAAQRKRWAKVKAEKARK